MTHNFAAPAHAKINLSLEILGKRADGYHDLVSLMQTISLADHIRLERAETVEISCSDPALQSDQNLAMRAANLLRERFSVVAGCHIRLEKRIPAGAGLGGGSSDAACTLRLAARLWGLPLSLAELATLGAELGSDVPFFVRGGTALICGRGERVAPIECGTTWWYVLAWPRVALSTALVYANVSPSDWSDGTRTHHLARTLSLGGPVMLGPNGLQRAALALSDEAGQCFADLERLVPGSTVVSGSGSASVALVENEAAGGEIARQLSTRYWVQVARSQAGEGEGM